MRDRRPQVTSTGGGLNGSYRLNATTVLEDGAVDVLYGDAGLDWFLASSEDVVNSTAGEIITDT